MEQLKVLRKRAAMTQAEIAMRIGVDRSTYAKYENGQSEPNFEMTQKLASLFGVTVDFLIGSPPPEGASGVWVPVLGDVAAGVPIEAVENIVDYEEIHTAMAATGEFFGLRVKGSSMAPRILEGDVVIVRKQDDAETGDTAVVLVNGDSATVKKIKKMPEGIQLIPTNPAYDPMYYTAAEVEALPVRIIGRVVELRGKF